MKNEFVQFFGIVEDINDPEMMGRARVRAYGYHSADKNEIPTEDLPWAMVAKVGAGVSGMGISPSGLVQGDLVYGLFMDGADCQQPLILCTLSSRPHKFAVPSRGFSDPTGEFPRYIDEPDTNRLARNERTDETPLKARREVYGSEGVDGAHTSWRLPEAPYAAVYPNNKVIETPSGHVIEIDDTPGAERIAIQHKSGSFQEIHPDGTVVTYSEGSKYRVVHSGEYVKVTGMSNKVYSSEVERAYGGEAHITFGNDLNLKVIGDCKIQGEGKIQVKAEGEIELDAQDDLILSGRKIHFKPKT